MNLTRIVFFQMLAMLLQPLGVCAAYLNPEVTGVSLTYVFLFALIWNNDCMHLGFNLGNWVMNRKL